LDLTYLPLQASLVTASALLAAMIGLLVLLRRGHWLLTLLFSSAFLSMAAFQAGTLGIVHADSALAARTWATYLAQVSALASWLWLALSVVLARPDPWKQVRDAGAYLTLALVGCAVLWGVAGTSWVVREVTGVRGDAVIRFGPMGKIYLMYLVVVMVAVLMNFERVLRIAPATVQRVLRPLFVAFLVGILSEVLLVSGGLLFSGLWVSWLAASAIPMFVAGTVTALVLARRRLSDMSVPVARPVIYYSSVSLTLAGAFLLLMAVLSKVVPVLSPEARRAVSLAFYLLAGGGGLLLTLSPRANRAVKRFVDSNFYANRYDYRREWDRVSAGIVPTARPDDVARQVEVLVCAIFGAERAAIYVRDDRMAGLPGIAAPFRRLHGPADLPAVIDPENALVRELERTRRPVVFHDVQWDLDLIPIAVENRPAIQAMAAAVCAPLQAGESLIGLLWLSEKRDDEAYTHEDAEFLGTLTRQLGAALWFARLAERLAETRQLESLNRLSSYVLHDIKNQVSGLSLVVQNARRFMDNPDFQRDVLKTVEGTVANLTQLMDQVAGMARPTDLKVAPCELKGLLDEAAASSGLCGAGATATEVRFRLSCSGPETVTLDRRLTLRVLINLLTNARESLAGPGEIELAAGLESDAAGAQSLVFRVRDTGRGMSEEFIRTSLFRPFATTKSAGLGVGLSQCRSIVEVLGGAIIVESRPGTGTTFAVHLPLVIDGTAEKTA
jgi:putative PEP-CTERM system histidine kinase